MKIVATYNIKGGVGKTSTAVNVAAIAARRGERVLLWDLDPQGAATFLLRVKAKVRGGGKRLVRGRSDVWSLLRGSDHDGLDLLPADFSYRHMDLFLDNGKKPTNRLSQVLAPLGDEYDLVVLDCPPSISLVSENVFLAADALLVPLIPTTLSLRTLEQLTTFVRENGLSHLLVLPFFSMVDRRKALHREIVATLHEAQPDILATQIPSATEVERMGVHRDVVAAFAPTSRVAQAYEALWDEVTARFGAST
ncbi:MAG: ParA family protein [Acidimicrobiales bacterium]